MNHRLLIPLIVAAFVASLGAKAATNYLAEADSLLATGQIRAAEIQLKNAVRSNPNNMEAHYRLAVVELQLGDAAAAEREAQLARAGGYDPDRSVPLVAQTYLLQRKYKQLLDEFPEDRGGPAERSGVLVARGYAQLALNNPDAASSSFKAAAELTPDAPQPLLAQAKLSASQQQPQLAEGFYDRVLKLDPKSNEARTGKADLLRITGRADQGLVILDEVVSEAPAYVPARLERAEILIAHGKDEQAKADLQSVLTAQPGNVPAIYLEAIVAAKAQDFENANKGLQKISGALAAIPRGYYVQAVVDYRLGHLDQAADAAQRYSARNPEDIAGKKLLAYIHLALRRPAEAINALGKFEAEGKADAEALALLGRSYTHVGKPAEALEAFGAAVKLAPGNAALRASLGEAELRSGQRSAAISNFEESLNLAPSAPAAEMLVLTHLADGDWQGATDAAKKLRQAEPNNPTAANLMGLVKLARLELEGARAEFAQLVQKDPEFVPARLNLARTLELEGNDDAALKLLNEASTKQPGNGVVLQRLVEFLTRHGKIAEAVSAAERAHQAAPDNTAITLGLIDLYLRNGAADKALGLARRQSQAGDSNVVLLAARARAEFAAGLKKEAAETYRRLVDIAPSQTEYRRQLAAVLASSDDVEGAIRVIEQALESDPRNPQLATDRIALAAKSSGVDGAVTTALTLKSRYPNLSNAPALEGDAYMAGKEFQKAIDAYTKAQQGDAPPMLVQRLAQAKASAGDRDGAATVLRNWLSAHRDDNAAALLLVSYDLEAQRFDQAKTELERILKKNPRNAVALNNLAWLYQRAGDARARSLAERAYVLAPNLAETADTLGWILAQQGETKSALALLKEASNAPTAPPAIKYHFAATLAQSGQPEGAVPILRELVKPEIRFDEKADAEKLLAKISSR